MDQPWLQLGVDLVLVLGLVEVVDDGFQRLAVGFGEAVPHGDLHLAVGGLLDVTAASVAGTAAGQRHAGRKHGRRGRDEVLLDLHWFPPWYSGFPEILVVACGRPVARRLVTVFG